MNEPTKSNIALVILAGGESSRMGGEDKGLMHYQGQALVAQLCEKFADRAGKLIISANRNIESYQRFGFEVVTDTLYSKLTSIDKKQYQGPIAGILAAAQALEGLAFDLAFNYLAVVPCDAPETPSILIERLSQQINSKPAAVANDGYRNHNLHCLIKLEQAASLAKFYRAGGRALHRWFEQVEATVVDFSDYASGFKNINSQVDLL